MNEHNVVGALKDIANCKLWVMIVLTMATFGFFPVMWLYRTQEEFFDELGETPWNPNLPIAIPVIFTAGIFTFFLLTPIALLAIAGIWIYWSCKMAGAIRKYAVEVLGFNYQVNMVLAVIFQYFYILYLINQLPAEYALQQKLADINASHNNQKEEA